MFNKDQRSTFAYWFAHWCAFNMTALNLGEWKFKYLFHDIEKPWLKLFVTYKKVQEWHRSHNDHHITYLLSHPDDYFDFEGMIIDWECSHFTKTACPLLAREEYVRQRESLKDRLGETDPIFIRFELGCERVLKKFKMI